ncbi:carbohydrate esterase family 4 protein [Pterulicium gracile]|uniref:Carbohydrate esterase family 4 protein n=1 Tax=Pterulicium gracile TaxID=1884261 RepID=A0A5C3Q133_9AGAR|nr:carbohydrate esterase family 4 protein [Pterula gracilis]
MLFPAAIISAALLSIVSAAPQRRAPAQVITSCTVPNTAALTFDDGPWVYAYDVSKSLVAAGAKGTFFLNGDNFECIYSDTNVKRVKYLHDKGHQLASHTWGHRNLTLLNWNQIHDEMWRVEEALIRIAGVQPAFMRPPFGAYNDLVREASGVRGQKIAIWDLDTGDTVGATPAESKARYDQAISQKPATIHSLAHETKWESVSNILPYAIQKLQASGYRLVTLAECLGEQPYQWTQAPGVKDPATWKC